MRELSELEKNPPEGIRVQTSDEDMLDLTGLIEGPGMSLILWHYTAVLTNDRGHTIRGRLLQGQIPVHGRVSSCSSKMFVFIRAFMSPISVLTHLTRRLVCH